MRLDRGKLPYAVDVDPISPEVIVTGGRGSGMSMIADEEWGVGPLYVWLGPPLALRPSSSADDTDCADGVTLEDALLYVSFATLSVGFGPAALTSRCQSSALWRGCMVELGRLELDCLGQATFRRYIIRSRGERPKPCDTGYSSLGAIDVGVDVSQRLCRN